MKLEVSDLDEIGKCDLTVGMGIAKKIISQYGTSVWRYIS